MVYLPIILYINIYICKISIIQRAFFSFVSLKGFTSNVLSNMYIHTTFWMTQSYLYGTPNGARLGLGREVNNYRAEAEQQRQLSSSFHPHPLSYKQRCCWAERSKTKLAPSWRDERAANIAGKNEAGLRFPYSLAPSPLQRYGLHECQSDKAISQAFLVPGCCKGRGGGKADLRYDYTI